MAGFSGAVRLTELNDFITPAPACVVMEANGAASSGTDHAQGERTDAGSIQIHELKKHKRPDTDSARTVPQRSEAVKISLHDCLACSGCITSAETVLLEQQSVAQLVQKLQEQREQPQNQLRVVASISPQSLVALAHFFNLPRLQTMRKLGHFFKSHLGMQGLFDVSEARDVSLVVAAEEFVQRLQGSSSAGIALPMLASACPGWVCYAEKTHASYILPYISTTKSPQQIMGTLLKRYLAPQLFGGTPHVENCLYHVTIMPCYDKKLEASRDDFRHTYADDSSKTWEEVDCVLTTVEIVELLRSNGVTNLGDWNGEVSSLDSLASLVAQDALCKSPSAASHEADGDEMDVDDKPQIGLAAEQPAEQSVLTSAGGSSSGGYLEYVMARAAQCVFEMDSFSEGQLKVTQKRSSDHTEYTLESPITGNRLLHCARVYGFRNIQNLVRKVFCSFRRHIVSGWEVAVRVAVMLKRHS